jgi:Kef-type K+ transport system membrane component KefB
MELFLHDLTRNLASPLSNLILQILVILFAARICGLCMRYLGQPQVVGEIIAGICLGPSLLGFALPEVHAFLFPEGSIQRLYFLSQVGILLFMFVVGLELDFSLLRSRAKAAIVISQVSIVIPLLLGVGLAFLLYEEYGSPERGLLSFALFMGIAMSITAFPVLARIVQEQGLTRTPIGATAITCAAVDDVTAWCLLAFVVGLVQSGTGANAAWAIGSAVVYALFMLLVARPFLNTRLGPSIQGPQISPAVLSVTFMAMLLSAFITEAIGIHALFGAFLMGVVMPEQNQFKEKLIARIQDVTTIVLLPLFFTFTGLRTQIGLLDDMQSWLVCGLVLVVAVLGKVGGAVAAARLTGYTWRMSWLLGALMNTRGLMELIVLNIGYDLGILSPKIFTMMVIMAIVTTMMTGPIVRLLNLPNPRWADAGELGENKRG